MLQFDFLYIKIPVVTNGSNSVCFSFHRLFSVDDSCGLESRQVSGYNIYICRNGGVDI